MEKEVDKVGDEVESEKEVMEEYERDLGGYGLKGGCICDEVIEVEESVFVVNEKEEEW
ncbi:hypothetical protein [Bacillus pumilus]|uniref:hypothetical protein n=1 Tax=Bacillus pumilus TaxID=1408 RepID=UPI00164259F6|nr:hypothetical protein [Bacillus pumilus]